MVKYKGVVIGTGYFSNYQYEAWNRIPEVEISACCSLDIANGKKIQDKYKIVQHYCNYQQMIDIEKPDFVDIVTPPETHLEMCKYAADKRIDIICQKPLAPTFTEAKSIVDYVKSMRVRFMVHENWRFQPWYREIKKLFEKKVIGEVHSLYFRSRMGDGWGENAYIPRQPYFRNYPRLIVYENGIHFIDTFRYLVGDVESVFAKLKKLNPIIKGEDFSIVQFDFKNGVTAVWDANRYNEPNYECPRYTFGEMLIDGMEGSIRLYADGRLTIQLLGQKEIEHSYRHENNHFAGDCVYNTQRHFIDCLIHQKEFETNGDNYLKSIAVQEAIYKSSSTGNAEKVVVT